MLQSNRINTLLYSFNFWKESPYSKWRSYVYNINDSITSLNYCGGECYFRKNDPCIFYAFHEEVCHLGNFNSFNEIGAGNSGSSGKFFIKIQEVLEKTSSVTYNF